jgi:hypothetical protein
LLEFLAYVSPAAVALLYAIARWVDHRARITSEVARSISREVETTSLEVPEQREPSDSEPDAQDPRK